MRIFNKSVSAVARSFAAVPQGPDGDEDTIYTLIWLDLAPQHPGVIKAIWATLVNNTDETLGLSDGKETHWVTGLHSRYVRLTAPAPRLASRSKMQFLRLVAPQACRGAKVGEDFYALEWRGISVGMALAAMLEAGSHLPIRIGWGDYLLAEAVQCGFAAPLLTSGPAPKGYQFKGDTPWAEIISEGVRRGNLSLEGNAVVPMSITG